MRNKLYSRIFICILISLLLAGALFYWALSSWVWRQNQNRVEEHLKAALNLSLEIAGQHQDDDWQTLAEQISRLCGYRVSFISAQGQVLGDSNLSREDFARLEDHGSRLEVSQALNAGFGLSQRHSSSLGENYIYVARPLNQQQAVLRLAAPLKSVQLSGMPWFRLAVAIIGGLMVMLFMAWWLARRYTRPFREIMRSLPAMAEGRFSFAWRGHKTDPAFQSLGRELEQTAAIISSQLAQLQQNAARMQNLLQGIAQPVILLNPLVALANPAAQKIFGHDLLGKQPYQFIRSVELLAAISKAIATREVVKCEAKLPGGQIWEAICSPIEANEQNEKQEEMIVILHDITQAKKLELMRKDFVANLSHEMRTPLAVIQGAYETLSNMPDQQPDQTRFLDSIGRQVKRLQSLMNDLLQLAHLESEQWQQVEKRFISVPALVSQAFDSISERARELGVKLQLVQPVVKAHVYGHFNTLEQVLLNLLDNALKYNNGQVLLRTSLRDNKVVIEVEDNGPGMESEHLPRIFERFYRVDASRPQGSTGLGLAIVRHGVMLHQGQVRVESSLNQGSRFIVSLPIVDEETNDY